ncbi:DNA repair protein RadC [Vibrio vulnificus]|uniref:RadC family protein n=1 Tax=Vibrio vulnificus TaxID=672 RepID=UPI001023D8B5|nr:DNA repair protein RadC [Vibrio vulnificus]MCU8501613.1 DNA repair protein RadC [Vibrio vulnificus]RZQ45872.1 DNA repair protein RadC [Vibrio vulnificus]
MFSASEKQILEQAAAIIESKIRLIDAFTSPCLVKEYCSNALSHYERECFLVLMLDNQNRLIKATNLFQGTIDSASVYPREVVKECLLNNAAAVIFSHNHPSGLCTPSEADRRITRRLVDALSLVDIRVLDHIVVGVGEQCSFAERGWL